MKLVRGKRKTRTMIEENSYDFRKMNHVLVFVLVSMYLFWQFCFVSIRYDCVCYQNKPDIFSVVQFNATFSGGWKPLFLISSQFSGVIQW